MWLKGWFGKSLDLKHFKCLGVHCVTECNPIDETCIGSWHLSDSNTMFAMLMKRWREEQMAAEQYHISTSLGGHITAWCSLMQYEQKEHRRLFKSCMNLLPGQPVEAECIGPWRLQRDTVWRAWEGEPGCHSGHCSEGIPRLGGTGQMTVWAWWPPLSSWPPGGCSPWLQFWRWHPGCPACPTSPETPGPALPSFDVGLTFVL